MLGAIALAVVASSVGTVRILGLDPGSITTGYGVIDHCPASRTQAYVECGVLRASGSDTAARIVSLGLDLDELIEEFAPDFASMERAWAGRYASAVIRLSEVRGAFTARLADRGVPLFEYEPSQAKKVVTGRGNASKPRVRSGVVALLRLRRPPTLDESDALALAVCHAVLGGRRKV